MDLKTEIVRYINSFKGAESSLLSTLAVRMFSATFVPSDNADLRNLETYRIALLNLARHSLRDHQGTDLLAILDVQSLESIWMPDYVDLDSLRPLEDRALQIDRIRSSYEIAASLAFWSGEKSSTSPDETARTFRSNVLHRLLAVLAQASHKRVTNQSTESDDDLDAVVLILLGRLLSDFRAAQLVIEEDRSAIPSLLGFASAESPRVLNALSATMARLLGSGQSSAKDAEHDEVLDAILDVADRWLDGSDQEHIRALWALALVLSASVKDAKAVILRDGFVQELVDYVEAHREATIGRGKRADSYELEAATAAFLSAGCSDGDVRKFIASGSALPLLLSIASLSVSPASPGGHAKGQAISALIKLMFMPLDDGLEKADIKAQISSIVSATDMIKFLGAVVIDDAATVADRKANKTHVDKAIRRLQEAFESLVYITLQPLCKELVCRNAGLLKVIISLANEAGHTGSTPNETSMLHYGILGVLHNLSVYRVKLSDEESHILKLQAMAKKLALDEPEARFDEDQVVDKRCRTLIASGALDAVSAILAQRAKGAEGIPASTAGLVASTIFNLTNDQQTAQKTRGLAVQRGFVPILLRFATAERLAPQTRATAAQCLARFAISLNPEIAFKGSRVLDLIKPLITNLMLAKEANGLHQFEALLALTNLASIEGELGDAVRDRIVDQGGMKEAETLQFSDNALLQRAATELFCNMVYHPSVFESFAGSAPNADIKTKPEPTNRLKTAVALCSSSDIDTQRAASGTIAILSAISPDVCRSLAHVDRAMTHICDLVRDKDHPDLQHRGAEVLKNCLLAGGDARSAVEKAGGVDLLRSLATRRDVIGEVAGEALASLSIN